MTTVQITVNTLAPTRRAFQRRTVTQPAERSKVRKPRDLFVDAIRAISTLAVISVHWLMPEAAWDGSSLRVGNALNHGNAWVLTWALQLLGVLFFASGAAATYQMRSALESGNTRWWEIPMRSLRRIAPPVLAFLGAWALAGVGLPALGVPNAAVQFATNLAPQLLWFLGVWVGLLALTPLLQWGWNRCGSRGVRAMAIATAIALPLAIDALRFGAGWATVGWVNVLLVWLVPYLLGIAYAERGVPSRRVQWTGFVGGFGATALLVLAGPYPASMIGMPGAAISNLAPPTAVVMTLAIGQISGLMLIRSALLRWTTPGRIASTVMSWIAERSMTLYLWHLTAMIVVVGVVVVGIGVDLPAAWIEQWLLTRPLWMFGCAAVLAALVAGFGPFERAPKQVINTAQFYVE